MNGKDIPMTERKPTPEETVAKELRKKFEYESGLRISEGSSGSYAESRYVIWLESLAVRLQGAVEKINDTLQEVSRELDEFKLEKMNRPKIVCLCGSSRFTAHMAIIRWGFEKQGIITFALNYMPTEYGKSKGYPETYDHLAELEGVSGQQDELHKRKIDLSDEIFVVNVDGYIGDSTRSEIEYAGAHGKPVKYLETSRLSRKEGE